MKFNSDRRDINRPAPSPPPAPGLDIDTFMGDIARQASGLGKGSATLYGTIDDLAAKGAAQEQAFKTLAAEIDAMVRANRHISEATQASNLSVQRARQTVESVGLAVAGVADTLAQVTEAAEDITKIALQTRLLAFNASTEAKHAGDAGRGFGIVAEAVKDLASRVERSSKLITSTIAQLDARIKDLSEDIRSTDHRQSGTATHDSFHVAVSKVERSVVGIADTAQKNLEGCAGLIKIVDGMSAQVAESARSLQSARQETEGFLSLSEELIERVADSGVETADTPCIDAVMAMAKECGDYLESGVLNGQVASADLFSTQYKKDPRTNPITYLARYSHFVEPFLPAFLERAMAVSSKAVLAVVTDRKGYVPQNIRKFCQPYSQDPVWNQANCRYRRFFDGRTEMAAIRSQKKFLLQTYRRDMGGGRFLIMKHLSAPIFVNGAHWGALRMGLEF